MGTMVGPEDQKMLKFGMLWFAENIFRKRDTWSKQQKLLGQNHKT